MKDQRKPVFDDKTRTNGSPQGEMVSTFDFLNDASGSAWEPLRALIQEWMDHIADAKAYNEILASFQTGDEAKFRSAYLELYLHEALKRAGYSVVFHPDVPESNNHPDFLVTRDDTKFYLEAIAPAPSDKKRSQRNREKKFRDVLNGISHSDFKIFLSELISGDNDAQAKKIRENIEEWLSTLDVEEIKQTDSYPVKDFSSDGWSVTVQAWVNSTDSKDSRAILGSSHWGLESHSQVIHKALKKKGNRYGTLEAPLLIAVGTYMHNDIDHFHINKALYHVCESKGGYFGQPGKWEHQHVSGALLINQLDPGHFHSHTQTTLWPHPGASHPLPNDINIPLTVVRKTEEGFIEEPGIRSTEFFGLSEEWPEGIRFPDLEDTE